MKGFLQSLPVVGKVFVDIQPEEVWAFWRFMQDHYRTTVVNKRDALEMQLVAQALDALGIQSRDRFLRNFTTTLGRRIYTPFEVGSPRGGWDLWSQVVICVHEHQHVVQHDREGLSFEVSYLADRAARARWEAEAYRSNLELHFWRYGTTPSARRIAEVLGDYGCRPEDVDVAAKSLALSAVSIRKGAVINEATHVALGWLDEHVPRLRAKGVV
ncbi:MAG: hypothetical protein IPM79_25970 [Polyangiaceae bacterium]|jgi:hypothetical protein|nr:hypothetical protein [Deltaproteobacteria bacterium]MBK8940966.1 hypothetical protein [Polyangiaceae bacterium]